jgi:hypothetical protein
MQAWPPTLIAGAVLTAIGASLVARDGHPPAATATASGEPPAPATSGSFEPFPPPAAALAEPRPTDVVHEAPRMSNRGGVLMAIGVAAIAYGGIFFMTSYGAHPNDGLESMGVVAGPVAAAIGAALGGVGAHLLSRDRAEYQRLMHSQGLEAPLPAPAPAPLPDDRS